MYLYNGSLIVAEKRTNENLCCFREIRCRVQRVKALDGRQEASTHKHGFPTEAKIVQTNTPPFPSLFFWGKLPQVFNIANIDFADFFSPFLQGEGGTQKKTFYFPFFSISNKCRVFVYHDVFSVTLSIPLKITSKQKAKAEQKRNTYSFFLKVNYKKKCRFKCKILTNFTICLYALRE